MGDDGFLGVTASLTGRRWVGPDSETERAAEMLQQRATLSPLLAAVLAGRGIDPQEAEAFLNPTLRELMPDPSTLLDADTAAERLHHAIKNKERVAIFADYDVDGGSSAALLLNWFRDLGQEATIYVPDRIDEGYGPNTPAMEDLAANHDLIICVDCGTLSHEPIAAATAKGTDVIVIDHHLGGETLPDARAIVNPNRQDETTPLTYLCAAGVVFMVLIATNRLMRSKGAETPDLIPALDLVALATVADVAPLVGLNRAFVRQGLKIMAERKRPGLRALSDAARVTSAPSSYHLGYMLGPRVNAGGRIGAADLGARLLSTRSDSEAAALAARLDALNTERRDIEASVLAKALEQAEERGFDAPLVWAAGEGWHPGVVGIVASRLKDAANRPALVIGFDGDEGKGSARSITGVDLGASIATLAREKMIEKGGGHKMAAGLSLTRAQLQPAMDRLSALMERQGAHLSGPRDLRITALVGPGAATRELVQDIEKAGPFGASAPAPRIAVPAASIRYAKRAGEKHLQLTLGGADGATLPAIAFNAFDTHIGPALENHKGAPFHIAGRLEIDDWGGRQKAKLRIEDAAPVTG
jgi:single-stranded-DNA-specific exonuclease